MIRKCTKNELEQAVDLAFKMNNKKEHYSTFCPLSRDSIHREFEVAINSSEYIVAGNFKEDQLTGLLLCYFDMEKRNGDCIGPFIDTVTENYLLLVTQLFEFIKSQADLEMKYTFSFAKENVECINFLESINADRRVNEYDLLLERKSFVPYLNTMEINNLDRAYYNQFIQLHDFIFPDVYISGKDIIKDINKNIFVFSIIEEGRLIAYSVLRLYENSKTAIAEIIGVDEEYRGKGYGKAILNHLIEYSFSNYDIEEIELIVDGDNETAISLYKSLGFVIDAENCCYIAK